MAIPIFIGAVAIGTGLLGVKKAYDAHKTNERAQNINRKAKNSVKYFKSKQKKSRIKCDQTLKNLGATKLKVLNDGVLPFVNVFKRVHNIKFCDSDGLNEVAKISLTNEEFKAIAELGSIAENIVNGAAGGVAAGALAAIGAYGAASTFGVVAGTGTAIGTLSGVAATNATLAFLGGGSLAAGGLGMAGGTVVLGGMVAGPALAVLGFVLNSKAEENLENAKANRFEAEKIAEQCETICTLCEAISDRCTFFIAALKNLSSRFQNAVVFLEEITDKYADSAGNADFRKFNENEKAAFAAACSLAKAVKSILDTPILNKNGKLTKESAVLMKRMSAEEKSENSHEIDKKKNKICAPQKRKATNECLLTFSRKVKAKKAASK